MATFCVGMAQIYMHKTACRKVCYLSGYYSMRGPVVRIAILVYFIKTGVLKIYSENDAFTRLI